MNFESIRKNIARNLVNFSGWQSKRKIIVIESDDWGSIRMPSKHVYGDLLKYGIPVNKDPYSSYDSLESEDDLLLLFTVLGKHKDKNNKSPIITTNTVVANPNFEKIRQSKFENYYFEPFVETYLRYPNHENNLKLIKHGIENEFIFPQFHGREHVNVNYWLNELRHGNKNLLKAFDLQLWGLGSGTKSTTNFNIQASFDALKPEEIKNQKAIIIQGLELFNIIFGFRAKSFIANNFIWDTELNHTLLENGITILQGMKYQLSPILNTNNRQLIRHRTGEFNNLNQVHLVRNCHFEPSVFPGIDSVKSCLSDIANAFFWGKPAIISTHRINFIGSIEESNRNKNLKLFDSLLQKTLHEWSDVEFMTSVQLGELIFSQKSQ